MKGKIVLLGIFMILLSSGLAGAATLKVGQGQTYATIQSALEAAGTDDIISVSEGTYAENVFIRKNGILLLGNDRERTIIDAQKTGSGIKIQANNVVVSGFTVRNNGGSGKEDAGISIYHGNNNLIANSNVVNNTVGISIYSSSNNNVISGNYIKYNYRNGISIFSSENNKIYNNNVQNNALGIYGDAARTSSIYSNNFIDNKDQAFDNSGNNAWDDGKSGNYWSNFKGGGVYKLLGGANAKDNYPLSRAVTIKEEPIPMPTRKPGAESGEAGKSSPGFTGVIVLVSAIIIAFGNRLKK